VTCDISPSSLPESLLPSLEYSTINQSINLYNSLSNTTPHGYLAATRMQSAVTAFWAPQQLGTAELRRMEKRCGVSRGQGEAWLFLGEVSRPRRCTAPTFPAIGSSILYPAEYLESKPPLRPIYGGKWNTTVLRCRQRRRRCAERRGGHREQVVWRRCGIGSNCYHYISYYFKYFCSLAVRLSQRTVVTFWRPTPRKIVHVIQNKLGHMTQLISFRAEKSLG
jgi:hypothetical protein